MCTAKIVSAKDLQIGSSSPDVSVVVPAFNYAHFLAECIESLSIQSLVTWECIVVDDASTDDTHSILLELAAREPRLRTIFQSTNQGPSAARNQGLAVARGRFIQFLDADDRLQPLKLEAHFRFLNDNAEVDIVYGDARFFRSNAPTVLMASLHGGLSAQLIAPLSGQGDPLIDLLSHHSLMPINAALIRREIFDRVGGFTEAMRGCEDWDWFLRAAILGARFAHHAPMGAFALIRSHSISASRDQLRLLDGLAIGATQFLATAAGQLWGSTTLPAAYEAALGIRHTREGNRIRGAGHLRAAALVATRLSMRVRWNAYALAAIFCPQKLFRWFVSRPMPEWPLELARRISRLLLRR